MRTTILAAISCATLIPCLTAQDPGPDNHARFGVGTTTIYFFRGLMQQDGGIIVQPELELSRDGVELFDVPFGWHVGTWNSLHEGQTGAGAAGGRAAWYESQFFAGFTVAPVDQLEVSSQYAVYHSPNGGFRVGRAQPTQELNFRATWNDSEGKNGRLKGIFPYAELAFELTGGRDAGLDKGTYLEIGAMPVIAVSDELDITVPVRVGLSLKDYYEDFNGSDDFFGFLSVGARGSLDLCDEKSIFGPWRLEASLDVYVLGGSAKRINNGDEVDLVGGLKLLMSF